MRSYSTSKVSLPIPKILDWNDDQPGACCGCSATPNVVEKELEQHMLCTKMLSLAMRNMASLAVPANGSPYFSDAPLDSHMKILLKRASVLVQIAVQHPGNLNPTAVPVPNVILVSFMFLYLLFKQESSNAAGAKLGTDLTSYCLGLIETGFSRLPRVDAGNRDLPPHKDQFKITLIT
ncbi:hypothetical protein GB937_005344 [Aspergillus fischeri]|nr:hypothetical protein GB937_005344 [Aspergillus fischeri]